MLVENVISFIDGRVRLRHEALQDAALGAELCAFFQDFSGIDRIRHNPRTGSMLITYTTTDISREDVVRILEEGNAWLKEHAQPPAIAAPKTRIGGNPLFSLPLNISVADQRKILHRSMLASFFTMLISGGAGNKKTHILAGLTFASLTLAHLYRMRKRI